MAPSRFEKKALSSQKSTTTRGEQKNAEKAAIKQENKVTYAKLLREYKGTGRLWEDPKFLADSSSLFKSDKSKGYRQYEWKRPKEIDPNAQLFAGVGGASRFDIQQGKLGDCWLLAATSSLAMHKELFDNVVPNDQDFNENYIGAIRFRFWRFGNWKEVIVDDRLPVQNGKLVYMHSADTNEFWSALLEKAYAKMFGSYEALSGGSQAEAMVDFTGGICETISLTPKDRPKNLFSQLLKFSTSSSLMGCAIESQQIEGKLTNGLITGHAYSLTDVKQITVKGETTNLVRVRNPWGNDREWKGAWSDDSAEWKKISAADKKKMGIVFSDDGEFWMSYEDFVNNFTKLEVCHLGPDSTDKKILGGKQRLYMNLVDGIWNKLSTAGGCPKFPTFYSNPQYRVEVVDADDNDEKQIGTLIVGLMQKDRRAKNLDFNVIGYVVYSLKNPENKEPLPASYFKTNKFVAKSKQFVNLREVCGRHELPPGHYVILPCTFEPKKEGDFIVRLFSQKESKAEKCEVQNEIIEVPDTIQHADDTELTNCRQRMEAAFLQVCQPKKTVNAMQLRDILNEFFKTDIRNFIGFDKETCRSMIALFDYDQTGMMEFDEFFELYKKLRVWKVAFLQTDTDNSGGFDSLEFREALKKIGYKLNDDLFNVIASRYVDPEVGYVSFDDFILCAVRLMNAFDIFVSQPPKGPKKHCNFEMNTFLKMILYN